MIGDEQPTKAAIATPPAAAKPTAQPAAAKTPRALPEEVRGIHVTMALASLDGKLEEYLKLVDEGLNTIELDVKDENGEVGFVPSSVPLARAVGAAKPYYKPREAARLGAREGRLPDRPRRRLRGSAARGRPARARDQAPGRLDLAQRRGLGWTNPYDKRVWDYNVSIAEVAARAGFDEIQFDYVRFPTDGDVDAIVYPGKTATPPGWVIAEFVHYATKRLKPLGVRVSTDLFGLAATRDLGIGQVPRRLSKYVDAIYPMVYPSHYGDGEYGLEDPNAAPGPTVEWALSDFRRR